MTNPNIYDKTIESDGPYSLEPVEDEMTQSRGLLFLLKGEKVNVGFFPSNKERETKFLSVKIPILRGLLGYRISLIRKDSLADFSMIESLDQLKAKYKSGFGDQWADMEILRINNIPTVGTSKYESLFNMLAAKRFDYFPRGINEAWNEIADRKITHPDLTVDPHIALYYPYPVYFFVNKSNLKLADRIERGLKTALEDGTFKELFLRYHNTIIQQADLNNRKLFILKNPTLREGTPEPDTSWWLAQTIKIGYIEFPPMTYTDELGHPAGIIIDITSKTLKKAGYEWTAKSLPTKRMAKMLTKGQVQLWIGLSTLPEFKDKTYIGKSVVEKLILRAYSLGNRKPILKQEDLIGQTILILRGYSYGGWINFIKDPLNQIKFIEFDSHEESFKALDKFSKQKICYLLNYKHPSGIVLKKLNLSNIQFNDISSLNIHFVVTRQMPDAKIVLNRIENAFQQLQESGVLK